MSTFRLMLLALCLMAGGSVLAQSSKQDSITHHYDSLAKVKQLKADSSVNGVNKKIDGVQSKVNRLANPNLNELISKDQIKKQKQHRDSVRFYKELEAQKKEVSRKIDSLGALQQPIERYKRHLDSLSQLKYVPEPPKKKMTVKERVASRQEKRDSVRFYQQLALQKKAVQARMDSLNGKQLPSDKEARQLDSLNALTYTARQRTSLKHQLDSARSADPAQPVNAKLDSVRQRGPEKQLHQAEAKANELQNKVNAPADKVEGVVNEKLALMNKEGGAGAQLPGSASLPEAKLPDASLSKGLPDTSIPNADNPLGNIDNPLQDQMKEGAAIKDQVGDIKGAPQEQLDKLKSVDEVQSAQSKLTEANAITDKAQGYGNDVKNLANGDLNEVKELPKTAEEQVKKLDAVQGFDKEAGQFDQYKQLAEKAKDPDALKEEALKQAPKLAVNHFAGKEEALQAAMDKMSKLKSKYSELNSIKDLPKKKPNAMRGKPLVERLVPGVNLQFQRSGDVIIDYNPYVGYRFYGRFTAGAGWNERFSVGKRFRFSLDDRIYGPRVFADFKVGKGFSVHTDVEKMNTYIPALTSGGYSPTDGYRDWVWSAFVGLKKEYQFMKKVKGTAQFLYNLYDDHNNSPYADRLVVRMGFEWSMKKKVKKKPSALETTKDAK